MDSGEARQQETQELARQAPAGDDKTAQVVDGERDDERQPTTVTESKERTEVDESDGGNDYESATGSNR